VLLFVFKKEKRFISFSKGFPSTSGKGSVRSFDPLPYDMMDNSYLTLSGESHSDL